MPKPNLIVGLDIGTTKVCAVVARQAPVGSVQVVGVASVPSRGLRRGVVTDLDAATGAIEEAVEQAERMAGSEIRSAVVSVSGDHIASHNSRGVVAVSRPDREISSTDVARALEAARMSALPTTDREILHLVPRQFVVDGTDGVHNPVGMYGVRLEVDAHVVTGSSTQVGNVVKCVERAGLEAEALVLEVLASAEAVLTGAERDLGVAVCDLGGGVTSVGVFQGGGLCHTAVLPVGGNHITNDIAVGLRTLPEEAERLKVTHGVALSRMAAEGELVEVAGLADHTLRVVPRRQLGEIIEPRVEEILDMIWAQIEPFAARLPAGVVLTGGSATLRGLAEAAAERWGLPVRVGRPQGVAGLPEAACGPAYATAVGLVLYASRTRRQEFSARDGAVRGLLSRLRAWLIGD